LAISAEDVKKLRDSTGAGMMDAKNALVEAGGDMEKAREILRQKGIASAAKRAEREARNGVIEAYVHGGKIGVLVEVNCETDFVARTDDFKAFARDIAMHIAAMNPEYVRPEDIAEDVIEKEKEIYRGEVDSSKPAEIIEKIVTGKLEKYFETVCLVNQPFVKDPDKTIDELTKELIGKVGENIVIRRMQRMELGEAS
jgi:elongation factor Ts